MDEYTDRLAAAERDLLYARRILEGRQEFGRRLISDEWLLVAGQVGEADLLVREIQRIRPDYQLPLLEELIAELRTATGNFTDTEFLQSSNAARRRNKRLFSS